MTSDSDFARDQVLILANPKAGFASGRMKMQQFVERLNKVGLTTSVMTSPTELTAAVALESASRRLRCVVAAGGDGTAELVANITPPGTPIATLPLGTENLLAKYLKLRSPGEVAAAIRDGATVQMDAGQLRQDGSNRLFLLMLSCGFDAEVIRRLDEMRSGHIHHLSYFKPIIDSIRSYQYPKLRVYCPQDDSTELVFDAYWVFVFNIPSYAVGLEILPGADPMDGLLDVCVFQGGSFWHGLMHFSAVVVGQHQSLDGFEMLKTRRLRIESEQQVPFQLDGEAGGYLPVEIEVLPQRLTYIVGQEWKKAYVLNPDQEPTIGL